MKPSLIVISSIALTALCWGIYGPVLHMGQMAKGGNDTDMGRLRAFLCVGLAYFVIAVIVPIVMLPTTETNKKSNLTGIIWSSAAGAAGAIGALGIILALANGGDPAYVMPLVFGLAPVVNAFFSIYLKNKWNEIGAPFLAGLIMVGIGAAMVLVFAPKSGPAHAAPKPNPEASSTESTSADASSDPKSEEPGTK